MAKIFIGSSSQMIPLVDAIAEYLRSDGHEPRPWRKTFEHGDITIDRLLALAHEVDGAILVFSGDDRVEYPGTTEYQPRGNVLIEFGLFLGYLGRKRAIICNHGENRKPSDLAGLTYLDVGRNADRVSQEAQERLSAWATSLSGGEVDPNFEGVTQIFSRFPLAEFRQAVRQAKHLHILQTFIPYTQHLHFFETDLMDAVKRDCDVQMLLSSPWSTIVELRQRALNPAYGKNIVSEQIRINLEHFATQARQLPADKRDRLKVRVHTTMPSMSIYRVDDLFFAGHYYQGKLAIDGPQLRVTNPDSIMGKRLVEEHLRTWQAATTIEVDLANIENWLRNGPP